MESKLMGVDSTDMRNCDISSIKENRLVPIPVASGSSGEGLPYAPEDWPYPGDKWRWKVGNRKAVSGHWRDRYLYPPLSCPQPGVGKLFFPSRPSVMEYLRKEFPHMDIAAFFSLFIWKVPCANDRPKADAGKHTYSHTKSKCLDRFRRLDSTEHTESRLIAIRTGCCKAGNISCSLQAMVKTNALPAKDCDICCTEVGFCHDCCCILCSRAVDSAFGGYSFVRCEAVLDENYICGHVAHVECALRSFMAGTIGGSIGLDVEYYCRRCDNRTDLMPHVSKLLEFCESIDSRNDVEKILSLGFCILSGSEQTRAKSLKSRIGLNIAKLKRGVHLDEIWKVDDDNGAIISECGEKEITVLGAKESASEIKISSINGIQRLQKIEATNGKAQRSVYITADYNSVSVKLEDDIDQILQELKTSQEAEYKIAEEKLYRKKDFILSLYRQLEYERSDLTNPQTSPNDSDCDALLPNVLHRVDQIKQEEEKLRRMMKIAHGFGRASKSIAAECFGLAIDD